MTTALEGGEGSASRPGRSLPPGKTRYSLYRRLGGPQAGVDRCGKSRPTGIRSPDRPVRSQSLYRLSYPAHTSMMYGQANITFAYFCLFGFLCFYLFSYLSMYNFLCSFILLFPVWVLKCRLTMQLPSMTC